jgi:LuxR family transcriptional regulator, maltose regulon positive regulatory protein
MLLTKLHIPPAGNNTVHRSELFEYLNIGLSRKLILISAPAGFGKTTLLSDWIHQNKIPTAWFSLDKGDNDPVEFMNYIISGIKTIDKDFGDSALRFLKTSNKPGNESIVSLLINDILNISHNFLLVLDDFHLISSRETLEIITYLLDHMPRNIHLAILTRSDPALSVARLRSQHQLVELRSSELSFSANDISILFNKKLKLGLSIEDIYSLETKTEGWIAGLQLTALSMQGHEDISKFIQDFKGDNRYIMDYLMEEVLKIQSDDMKEFLLQTSILEQMSAPLCNTLLKRNDSQEVLDKLDKNNMFVIPLDDERNWYRYHHLFAELLKQRLLQKDKAAVVELHYKASEWFYNHSIPLSAIEHALEAGNFEKSMQYLGEIAESLWANGHHAAILKYGDLIPDELIKKNADFCLYYSWILIIAGQIQNAEPFLISAEIIAKKVLDDKNSSDDEVRFNKKLLGKISVAFAYLYSITQNSEKTLSYCNTAMENLTDEDPLWFSWGWYSVGIANSAMGKYTESIDAYEKALAYGKKSGNIYLISTIAINVSYLEVRMGLYTSAYRKCSDLISFMIESGYSQIAKSEPKYAGLYSCMAGIECMRTDFDEALANIKIAYDLSRNDSNNSYKVVVLMVYWLILVGLSDDAGREKMLNETENIIKHNIIAPAALALFIAGRGKTLIEQAQYQKARDFLNENGIDPEKRITFLDNRGLLVCTLLLIKESKFDQAGILLSELQKMSQSLKRIEDLIVIKIHYAILFNSIGEKEKAITSLIESLEYAADENIIMAYIHYHDEIQGLLKEIFKNQIAVKAGIPVKLIEKLKLAIEKREKSRKISSESGLSDRELDALKLIATDLSYQEIADKLFISVNTAKTHIRNIYLKFDVDNRAKAIARAKEFGLL